VKAKSIERAILEDREQRRTVTADQTGHDCFRCGKSFVYRGPRGDNSGRFCSDQCRIEYDHPVTFDPFKVSRWCVVAGGDPGYLVTTPMTRVSGGFRVECRGCGKPFESGGWAYCSRTCKAKSAERQEARALMAEAGIDAPVKRKCLECGGDIPRWRNGRQVSKVTKFCKPQCAARARRKAQTSPTSLQGVLSPETAKTAPENGPPPER
jgi:hypothetical protein